MRQFDDQIPGYIGRILSGHGDPVGTCFQVEPHVLVTAWHVVEQCGAGEVGSFVEVDSLSPGASPPSPAEVERIDPDHDLAVLRRELPLSASVEFFEATDTVSLAADVIVTGHSRVEDYGGHAPVAGGRRFLHALGTWTGGTVSDKGVALGRLSAPDVVLGMSGAPVRQLSDGAVVGMVCARYSSAGQWLPHAVWVTRIEDLRQLLAGMVDIAIPSPELQRVLQLVKDREDLYVYVKRLEIRRGEPGNQDARAIPVIYQQLREIYFDLGVLSGPDGPFPTAILPLAPAVADDPEALLGQILPRQPKPVLEPRIIKAIQARGSDIWDGTTFSLAALRLDPQGCAASLDAFLGSYFDMVCSAGYLEYELLAALRERADQPFSLEMLPVRQRALALHPTPGACLRAGGGVDAAIAISTLVVYKREAEYWIMCEVRSKKVAEYGDLYHIIPSFIFQPVVAPNPRNLKVEWSIRHNIYREYLEELFSVSEVQHSEGAVDPRYFYAHPNLRYLQRLLGAGGATLSGVAFIFNLLNHRPELCTLLLITDEAWYEDQRLFRPAAAGALNHLNLNDEFMDHEHRSDRPHVESVTTLPLSDDRWAQIARPWLMVPPGAPALILGAREACRRLGLAKPAWLARFTVDR